MSRVHLIMPTHNRAHVLRRTFELLIHSLLLCKVDWRLLVYMNGCTDGTADYFKSLVGTPLMIQVGDRVVVYSDSKNIGIDEPLEELILNGGVSNTERYLPVDYLGKVDDDLIFPYQPWLDELIADMERAPSIGAISPCHFWETHPNNPDKLDEKEYDFNIVEVDGVKFLRCGLIGGCFIARTRELRRWWRGSTWYTTRKYMMGERIPLVYRYPLIPIIHLGDPNVPGNIVDKEYIEKVRKMSYEKWMLQFKTTSVLCWRGWEWSKKEG